MLSPVEVSLFPSCDDALAWSPDGDLAIAAGEYVQILTPQHAAPVRQESGPPSPDGGFHVTRFRANLFTHDEWPCLYPQNRADFSIAAELSLSTVIGLAWSPAGLGKYRRSVLAVLTSNLLLSFYEPLGPKRQWTRVTIVNQLLRSQLSPPAELEGLSLRKCNIRSFQWCSPLRPSAVATDSTSALPPENRWGTQLLAIANDANEVMLLCVRRSPVLPTSNKPYSINVLTRHFFDVPESYSMACTGSLLQTALQSKSRVLTVSCGPWLVSPVTSQEDVHTATATVAAIHGTQLRMVKASVTLQTSDQKKEDSPRYEVVAELTDHPIASSRQKWTAYHFTRSLQWIHPQGQSATITLAAGINSGFLTMYIPRSVYEGKGPEAAPIEIQEEPFYEPTISQDPGPQERHLEPISAMTTSFNEKNHTWTLHFGTLGGLALAAKLRESDNHFTVQSPRWGKIMDEFRERFDLDRDLGGSTTARVWGLASYRGVTAVLFTRHPGDTVVYRMAADDSATIVFSSEDTGQEADMHSLFSPKTALDTAHPGAEHRRHLLHFILDAGANDDENSHSQKLVYAAACCVITDEQSESLRSQARGCLERLSTVTGVDLSEEMAKCTAQSPTISAKSADQISGPGGHIFERCEICDAGIGWFSAREAQCANGHLFVRCGLTFLAIQEPGISKFCSWCGTECLDEEAVALLRADDLGPIHRSIFDTFDTCLYCGGKFQASA